MWHPASLLLTWLAFALGLSWAPLPLLIVLSPACLVLAMLFAPERSRNLLRRSRWLLLSLAILFLFATPGEYLPGMPGRLGMTYEGLSRCGEQMGRLLAILASLALLHQQTGTQGLVAGCYWLLRPFSWCGITVVRLMLVLELLEQKQRIDWRASLASDQALPAIDCVHLVVPPLRRRDMLLMGFLLVFVVGLAAWA